MKPLLLILPAVLLIFMVLGALVRERLDNRDRQAHINEMREAELRIQARKLL